MAKEYIFVSGKAKWFKHQQPNKFGAWAHDIYLDDKSLELIKKLLEPRGNVEPIKNKLRLDDDGYNMTFKRDTSKTMRGKIVGFAPPIIIDRNNDPIIDQLIGNGSDVTTKLEYYEYPKPFTKDGQKGSAVRWFSTRIDNLVPFVMDRDFDHNQEKQIRGLPEQPSQPLF